jgi:hypothetical protein
MKKFLLYISIYFCSINLIALDISPEYYNWHFGYLGALSFNNPNLEPVSYGTSRLTTLEGCASISDKDANLLFYTNGERVWNRFDIVMPNGTDLKGHNSATQSAIIVRKPGSDKLYYIFTVGKGPYPLPSPQDFCYSIVDMDMDVGAGDVIVKNIKVHNVDVVEKLTAVMHSNNKDYWIIAHELNSANFVVVLLTENGIQSVTTQKIGPVYTFNSEDDAAVTLGYLKSNVRGDKLAAVCFSRYDMDLYNFDRKTGVISDHLPIRIDNLQGTYGVEFSPSGQFVYTSNVYRRILQFDISDYNKNAIELSRTTIYSNYSSFQSFGSLQLAPDGKIYIAIYGARNLSAINKPDLAGIACDLQFNTTGLVLGFSEFGLPNFCVTESYEKLVLKGNDVCEDEVLEIESLVYPSDLDYTYQWTGPNGFTSNLSNIRLEKAKLIHEGYYTLGVYESGDFKILDSIYIVVHPLPKVKIIGPQTICPPDKVTLKIDEIEAGTSYFWFDGSTNFDCQVSEPGRYFVVAISAAGCVDTAFFDIEISTDLDAKIMGPKGFCKGDTIKLTANKSKDIDLIDYSYLWSTGETTRSIIVTEAGEYSLQILREGGCVGYDTVHVTEYPEPDVQLSHSGIEKICAGQQLKLFVIDPSISNNYHWEDGIIGTARIITEPGVYKIYASNQYQCLDSAEIEVQIGEKPVVNIELSNDLNFCRGDSVTVTVNSDSEDNLIIWEDGKTDLSRTFSEGGKYEFVVTNAYGCSDTTEFEIIVFEIEKPEIIADIIYVCEIGTPVTLSANQEYHQYLWSNGATTPSTVIDKQGVYKLHVSNENGCLDSAEIEIFVMPIQKPEITASKYLVCDNDTLTFTVNGDYATYLWSDGSTGSSAVVSGTGTFKLIVTNEIGCVDSAEVTISDLIVDISFSQSEYSEKTVCTGTKSLIKSVLENHTEFVSTISEIVLDNSDNFKLVSPELPFTIGAFASREIILEATSDETGLFETSILVISNHPCYLETMSSASQKFSLTNQIRLPEIEAVAGEQLCIPIYGQINCGSSPFVSSATIQISFDAEYFNVISLKSGNNFTKVIENGICTITIEYDSLSLTHFDEMIDELCGSALIGSSTPIALVVSEVDWSNDYVNVERLNGKLSLESCVIDMRSILYFKPTAMKVSPLPANENLNVNIESGSIGTFELILVGFDGTQEVLRTWENTQSSSVDLLFDVSTLSQGVYSLLLKAPWSIHYEQILILR